MCPVSCFTTVTACSGREKKSTDAVTGEKDGSAHSD